MDVNSLNKTGVNRLQLYMKVCNIKIVVIVLKITEFISLMISTANVCYFMKETRYGEEYSPLHPCDLENHGRLDFFVFTTSTGMIIVLVGVLLFITGKQGNINGIQAMTEVYSIWAIMLLLSSVLLAKTIKELNNSKDINYDRISMCDVFKQTDANYLVSSLNEGLIFGVIAMFSFILDSGIYILIFVTTQRLLSRRTTDMAFTEHFSGYMLPGENHVHNNFLKQRYDCY